MSFARRVCPVIALLVAAGCGGGGGSSPGGGGTPTGSGTDQTVNIGNFVTRVSGTTQQPISVAGSGATVVGVAGGTVSSLTLANPVPTLANSPQTLAQTHILFSRYNQLYMEGADGSGVHELTLGPQPLDYGSAWSPDGSRILFSQYVSAVGHYQIFVMNANGSGASRLSDGSYNEYAPAWNSAGNKIAFTRYDASGHTQLYTMTPAGGSVARISDGTANDDFASWSPAGDRLVFMRATTGSPVLYVMNADGSGAHLLIGTVGSDNMSYPGWSPDGTKIVYIDQLGSSTNVFVCSSDGTFYTQLTMGIQNDATPCWSPDSAKIAFARPNSSGLHQIYTIDPSGAGLTAISDGSYDDMWPVWSPYIRTRRLVGQGGLASSAAGFLAGQQGNVVNSLVVFNATTPDSAFITVPSSTTPGQSSLALTVTADKLTSLVFVNNFASVNTVLGGTTTATGASITFNANDGTVSTVLPFNANKSALPGGSSVQTGDVLVLRRSFIGVWDGKGKNLAPGGASEVHISSRSGRLISFR